MKRINILVILALLIFGVVAPSIALSKKITDIRRFFYEGDGWLNLVCPENGISFNGRFRNGKGIYDEKALNKINRLLPYPCG